MENIKLVRAQFQMDCGDEELPILAGYFNPNNRYWNGFANPYLDQANRDAWIAFSRVHYKDMPEIVEELETITPDWVDGKYLYYFGGAYIWHEVNVTEC